VVDGSHQALLLTLAAVGPDEVAELRLGPLTPPAVRALRTLREFFAVQFSIQPQRESQTLFLSCVGAGIRNLARKIT
jgi:RNA 3'-terminal phosphate cyclase-like protein